MYFPKDMNFQYFFFSTYPGYFLQILPVALLAGAVYWAIKFRGRREITKGRMLCGTLFVCYMAGLVCLLLALDAIGDVWYLLLYHRSEFGVRANTWDYNLIPHIHRWLEGESLANIALYLPFGFLYPLAGDRRTWKRTLLAGFLCSLGIELVQPLVGRAFDINDIMLNTLGVLVSATLLFAVKKIIAARRDA